MTQPPWYWLSGQGLGSSAVVGSPHQTYSGWMCVQKAHQIAVVLREARKNMDGSVEVLPPLLKNKFKVYPLLQCYCFNLLVYLNRQF